MIIMFLYQGWQRLEIHKKIRTFIRCYAGQIIFPVDWVLEIINGIAFQAFLINQKIVILVANFKYILFCLAKPNFNKSILWWLV